MPSKKGLMRAILIAVCGLPIAVTPAVAANAEKVLYSFQHNGTDGWAPVASVVFDAGGNLYGTTLFGGTPASGCKNQGCGTIFQLAPGANGKWTETVLYSFKDNGTDGTEPLANLTFDADGNLYGTTLLGGDHNCGTVFELTPDTGGAWTETVLYSFAGYPTDGAHPYAGLIFDAAGNLYGTTRDDGGYYSYGMVFRLTPSAGTWVETVLYAFGGEKTHDGGEPYDGLIFDAAGNLYGTFSEAGIRGGKAIGLTFQLAPGAGGSWTETVLYGCTIKGCADQGGDAHSNVIFDTAGNLYSTTSVGGAYLKNCGGAGCGTVFQQTPKSGGKWPEKVIHSFGKGNDGETPEAGLVVDAAGQLYGTTEYGGAYGGGTVFRLTRGSNDEWKEKVLHSFGNGKDGANVQSGLILDGAGNLYGTTTDGGAHNSGTVFEITP